MLWLRSRNRNFMIGRLLGLLCAVALWGQSLRVPPSSTHRKSHGSFAVFLDSPQGQAPVALQWEFQIPPAVKISTADIAVGKAAESAGKSLACAVRTGRQAAGGTRYACILAGGVQPIPNGNIAVVRYEVPAGGRRERVGVILENAVGVSVEAKSTGIQGTTAVITIR